MISTLSVITAASIWTISASRVMWVPLDSVGGTMLLIRADVHRDGLIFPPFLYGKRNALIRDNYFFSSRAGEIETKGLGVMASDMGYECWGMPNLEIRHYPS